MPSLASVSPLLDKDADPHAKDQRRMGALAWAEKLGQVSIVADTQNYLHTQLSSLL